MDLLIAPNTVAYAARDVAPANGTPGWATGGNPGTGVPATIDEAYQYNALIEEVTNVIKASGVALDRTNNAQLLGAVSGRLINIRTFQTSGTYTPAAGVTKVKVTVVGGGAGGSECQGNSLAASISGGGGGGGGAAISLIPVSSIVAPVAVTVGVQGTQQVSGGTSSFGNYVSATGGTGSKFTGGGVSPGGGGGVGLNGNVANINGSDGSDGQSGASFIFAGDGGSSFLGGGGRAGNLGGTSGGNYGGGGGGAYDATLSNNQYPGGAGAPGVVIVEEYA
ncbi:hypothetical protein HN018_06960 [Lichenicola cladoniae]|uniref:Glycine-rich domain-containing protein n=1 Tax=Lichenicola cladoniae TaxID=1484109 RepID=A0A6M8HNE3_9PROT|nr:hypothetical protein [Lichenicola cladoniae]NPD67313.1 hypothetical protein [Acetobacteraceae bacterium]QKE89815.1 hypothetical protein HN018_06960 [Lichenicola cladoniae]